MTEMLPTETACHEAGHVVVAKLLGMPTASIVLKPQKGVLGESDVHLRGRASVLDRAAITFAGWYAQCRAYPESDKRGACSDMFAIKIFLKDQPKGTRERIRRRVKKLLAENWTAVLALAAEIDRHGVLHSDDLATLGYFWEAPEPDWLRID